MKKSQLDILYSDADIVVVNKPSGLLAIPDRFDKTLPDVKSEVRERFGDAWVVHRLDRDTSGVMIVALNADAHRHLNEQFEHHRIEKYYLAIVSGVVDRDDFPIDIPIAPDSRKKGLMKPSAKGKEAHTIIHVEERFRVATLLTCRLITGRQHQIRVHCAAIGHPLLVDPDYGKTSAFLLSAIKRRYNLAKDTTERPIIDRLTLHASSVTFTHPSTELSVSFSAEPPKDFTATLKVLRKYAAPYASVFGDELDF